MNAERIARAVLNRTSCEYTQQDLEDATQIASTILWQQQDKAASYQYVAAKRGVATWFYEYQFGDKSRRAGSQTWFWQEELKEDTAAYGDPAVTEARHDAIMAIMPMLETAFAEARQKRGRRGEKAARLEMQVIILTLQGYNLQGISKELGVPYRSAQVVLSRARQKIKEVLNNDYSL